MSRPFRIFVSSTTADLGSYREAAARIVREKGLEAIDEGWFPTMAYQAVRRHLWERVQISDAVLFLIGFHFGGEPSDTPFDAARRSFAQMEWDFAELLAKPRYALLAGDDCPFDNAGAPPEPQEKFDLQRRHREVVAGPRARELWHTFNSREKMEELVCGIDFPTIAPQRPRKPRVLPYSALGPLFLGRTSEIAALREHFAQSQQPAALVPAQTIYGLGGVGKTRLAVEYAWAFDDSYDALLFVSAETPATLAVNLSRLARPEALALCDPAEDDETRQREAVLRWLETERGWLLIIDNADSADAADAVRTFLPRLANGHVLITSRLADWTEGVQPLALGVLSQEASVTYLLKKCVTRREARDDSEVAGALAADLGFLALALEQAGAFINMHGASFREYRERWQREDAAVRSWFDEDLMRYPRSVATTWETSFAELGEIPRALLRFLCWLSTEPAPRGLFRTTEAADIVRARLGVSKAALLPALKELADYTLIHYSGDDAVQIHRLVQEVTRARLPNPEERRDCLEDCLAVVDAFATGNPHEPNTWTVWEPLRPHILVISDWAEMSDIPEPTGRLLNQLAILLLRKAAHEEAKACMCRALRLRAAFFGPESAEVAAVEGNLGTIFERLDRFGTAEEHYKRALAIVRARTMDESSEASSILNNLAALYVGMNRFDEAAAALKEAIEIERRILPQDSPLRAPTLSNQGVLFWRMGKYAEAQGAYREAIAIAEAHHGEQYPEVSAMRSNLGLLLQDIGRFDEAEECFRRAFAADTAVYGSKHPAVGRDSNNLALLLRARGKLNEAETLLSEALHNDRNAFGDEHSEVADGYNNLGLVLLDMGRDAEAEDSFRRALAIDENLHGPSHVRVAIACLNLGAVLKNRGEFRTAFRWNRRALKIQREKLGPNHPELASTWNNLARLLQLRGKLKHARGALWRAMAIDRKAFGRRHPRRGTRLTILAQIYWQDGRLDRAEKLYAGALAADRALHGGSHPEIAVDLYNYAELLRALDRPEEAHARHAEAAAIAALFLPSGEEPADPRLRDIVERWGAVSHTQGASDGKETEIKPQFGEL
jgi:tetratricopeptide (TPR) repeat protein